MRPFHRASGALESGAASPPEGSMGDEEKEGEGEAISPFLQKRACSLEPWDVQILPHWGLVGKSGPSEESIC